MRRAEFGRTPRWVQRIGEQDQSVGEVRLFGCENRRLPSAVRMPPEEHASRHPAPHRENSLAEAFAVARGVSRERRSMRAQFSERECVARDLQIGARKRTLHRYQQRRVGVRAGAVREDQRAGNFSHSSQNNKGAVLRQPPESFACESRFYGRDTFSAWRPFGPLLTSNSTSEPSSKLR